MEHRQGAAGERAERQTCLLTRPDPRVLSGGHGGGGRGGGALGKQSASSALQEEDLLARCLLGHGGAKQAREDGLGHPAPAEPGAANPQDQRASRG